MSEIEPHEHVTIDEEQFHALNELRHAARAFIDGAASEEFLQYAVEKADRLTALARERNDEDPRHHLTLKVET